MCSKVICLTYYETPSLTFRKVRRRFKWFLLQALKSWIRIMKIVVRLQKNHCHTGERNHQRQESHISVWLYLEMKWFWFQCCNCKKVCNHRNNTEFRNRLAGGSLFQEMLCWSTPVMPSVFGIKQLTTLIGNTAMFRLFKNQAIKNSIKRMCTKSLIYCSLNTYWDRILYFQTWINKKCPNTPHSIYSVWIFILFCQKYIYIYFIWMKDTKK